VGLADLLHKRKDEGREAAWPNFDLNEKEVDRLMMMPPKSRGRGQFIYMDKGIGCWDGFRSGDPKDSQKSSPIW
jgi:hypothetical protein